MDINLNAASDSRGKRILQRLAVTGFIYTFLAMVTTALLGHTAQVQNSSELGKREWIETSSFDDAFNSSHRHELGNFVAVPVDGYIYVIGGSVEDPADTQDGVPTEIVIRSRVKESGGLEQWQRVRSSGLPRIEYSMGTSTISNCIYLVGGSGPENAGPPQNWVFYSKPDDSDRSLSWNRSTIGANHIGRNQNAVVSIGNQVFTIGGWGESSQGILDEVLYAEFKPDSCSFVGGWHRASDLLVGRYAHAAIAYDKWIYAIGGRSYVRGERADVNSVEFASVDDLVARTNAWTLSKSLPISLSRISAIVTEEGTIYVTGGRNSSTVSTRVYSTTIDRLSGELRPWQDLTKETGWALPYPSGLNSHNLVYWPNGSVYLLGGRITNIGRDIPVDYVSSAYYIPPLAFAKYSEPSGPIHEGDFITYTLAYANTSLRTQTITITDVLPFNLTLIPDTVTPTATTLGSTLVWSLGEVPPGGSGQLSFQARVALLPSLHQAAVCATCPPDDYPPAHVLPVPITCDTTRFWVVGVTRQPPKPIPNTIQVQIPPGINPTAMWLLMKGTDNTAPTVEGSPAQLLTTSHNVFGASVWTSTITPGMTADGEMTVVTDNPRELNALFLFDDEDPPFDETTLYPLNEDKKTFAYTLEIPTVETQTLEVIMPFMDITYWTDSQPPAHDGRLTTVAVKFDDQPTQTIVANEPNLGNGLLMTQFPFTIGAHPDNVPTMTKRLTVTVDTEDSIYTLEPRICRPVRIENTAWLCSLQAGCISSTVINAPAPPKIYGLHLPIILKSHP